ncbi:IclR family transcriptional regulator [Aneurinibacillus terranovensis]|uniref:IclR family transcriptional regulator n=1 Tax=Aneurinibacillus terranovensis TaxID=278991 RepID=UPI000401FDF7|nr:IclR family transcriptional regulator [Aneurinibacillus terranovensis]
MGEKNKTIVKSMEVLSLFYKNEQLSLQDMVELSGRPKTSIYRLVGSLEEMGFLQKNESGKYVLGLIFLQLGHLVAERLDIRQISLPVMRALRDDVGEAVNLIMQDGKEAIYIEKVDTMQPVRVYTQIGRRAPLYAGACPRILLAFLSRTEQDEYINHTEMKAIASGTLTDPAELRSVLDQSRVLGYSVSHSELEDHTSAVAVPIFNHAGEVAAGLSIAGPEGRFKQERLPQLVEKVKQAANQISQKLGWVYNK